METYIDNHPLSGLILQLGIAIFIIAVFIAVFIYLESRDDKKE